MKFMNTLSNLMAIIQFDFIFQGYWTSFFDFPIQKTAFVGLGIVILSWSTQFHSI